MRLRKTLSLVPVMFISLCCYIYLSKLYNPKVIEYRYNGDLNLSTLEELRETFGNNNYNIKLMTNFSDYRLIATTGKELMMESVSVEKGSFLIEPYADFAVIGDKVADRYFSSIDCIDKEIYIFGINYKIKGIIRNSNEIYVPFSEELNYIHWDKKLIQFISNNDVIEENLNLFLLNIGIDVKDVIIYSEKIQGYINLSILIAMIIFISYGLEIIKKLKDSIIQLWIGYSEQKQKIELFTYMRKYKKAVLKGLRYIISVLFIMIIIYILVSKLSISPSHVPTNLFSISSYVDVFKVLYSKWMFYLEYGFSRISIDMIKLNIIMFGVYIITTIISSKYKNLGKQNLYMYNKKYDSENAKF